MSAMVATKLFKVNAIVAFRNWINKKFSIIIVASIAALLAGAILQTGSHGKSIRVAYPSTWGSLIPPLQHTLIASAIISNEFEPLVQYGSDGVFVPLACVAFDISPDFKIYKFKINTKKRFSDGSYLTSFDFKKSFEEGLKLEKFSHNQSSLDGLYQLEGFENFKQTGHISGIIAEDREHLELHYKTTFRQALQYIKGSRFSVFKVSSDGKYIGTGPWVIKNLEDNKKLLLEPNLYYATKKNYNVDVFLEPNFLEKLKENEIDIAEVIDSSGIDCLDLEKKRIDCLWGDDERHVVLDLNQFPNRLFSNKNYRQALLFLISQLLEDPQYSNEIKDILDKVDMQFFLPLQKGRLESELVKKYKVDGEKFVDALIKETQKKPIFFVTARNHTFIINYLKSKGVLFSERSGQYTFKEVLKMGYETSEPDVISGVFSIASGDPDGLYHALGKNGGISFPMSYNVHVGNLLEEGRQLIADKEISDKYEEINRTLFNEASTIHLGFQKQLSLYRSDNVRLLEHSVKRSDHRLSIYAPR